MTTFLRLVQLEFERAARDGDEYTRPWLDLDAAAYHAYRDGLTDQLPAPFCHDPALRLLLSGAQGLDVLCLAGGGGQQSAVFGLLGANVTVFDLMPGQLEGDRAAAAHYGYPVAALQGDMHDLSALPEAAFERVYQPISTLYCFDLPRLYAGVARVLRPGGLYAVDFACPLLYMAEDLGFDGTGYLLRVREPYRRGEIRETPAGRVSFSDGQPIGEYHHLLSDILNGLIAAGLSLVGLWESPRPDLPPGQIPLPGGMDQHRVQRIPFGLTVVARRS